MSDERLPVHLYGTLAGWLSGDDETTTFDWAPEAIGRWGVNSSVMSTSLPVGRAPEPDAPANFFGGMLPEGIGLEKLAQTAQVGHRNIFGMYRLVGRDLAGALVIGNAESSRGEAALLNPQEIGVLLDNASGYVIGGGGSALPGFQRKITLTRLDGRWYRGGDEHASTHILKPVATEYQTAAHCEDYTLRLSREIGLSDYETWVEAIDGRHVLVIERYDREIIDGAVQRIHQEDFAQASNLPWTGDDKFEQNNDHASLRHLAQLLDSRRSIFSPAKTSDRERLLQYTTFNVAVGNTDAHAKNHSMLRLSDGTSKLAPLYDAAPLALDPDGRQTLAMFIGGNRFQWETSTAHLVSEGASWGIAEGRARDIVAETLAQLEEATYKVTADSSIEHRVPGYIRGQARNLANGKKAYMGRAGVPPHLQTAFGTPGAPGKTAAGAPKGEHFGIRERSEPENPLPTEG